MMIGTLINNAICKLLPEGFRGWHMQTLDVGMRVTYPGFDPFEVPDSTPDIKAHCRAEMLRLGWPLRDITCNEIADLVRKEFPDSAHGGCSTPDGVVFDIWGEGGAYQQIRTEYNGRAKLIGELVAAGWKRKTLRDKLNAKADQYAQENATKPQRFYGTRPLQLPKTLPVGTRTKGRGSVAASALELLDHPAAYRGLWRDAGRGYGGVAGVEAIDWSTVSIQDEHEVRVAGPYLSAGTKDAPFAGTDSNIETSGETKLLCSWCHQPSGSEFSSRLPATGEPIHPKCLNFSRAHAERLASGGVDCPEEREATERFVRAKQVDRSLDCLFCGRPGSACGHCGDCRKKLSGKDRFEPLDQRVLAAQPAVVDESVAWSTPSAEGP